MKSSVTADGKIVTRRVGYLLKRAQHALRASIDASLHELDVNLGQYAVLEALADVEGPSISNAALARRCFVKPQTANQLVSALIERGAVEKRDDAFPGRAIGLTMTASGRRLLGKARALVNSVESKMLHGLSTTERERLAHALAQCAEALEGS